MDQFLIPKIPRVEESCDVEEEEEMQGVSESDLEEEERRGQRDQPYTKMALRMVDTVVRSLVLFMFLFICTVFSNPSTITFSREELMNVRHSFPQTLSPDFTDPETFLEILVGGAAALCGAWRRRRRGKRTGALVKLRERGVSEHASVITSGECPLSAQQNG